MIVLVDNIKTKQEALEILEKAKAGIIKAIKPARKRGKFYFPRNLTVLEYDQEHYAVVDIGRVVAL